MKILIATEKHTQRHIDATESVELAAKKLVVERLADGWYLDEEATLAQGAIMHGHCWLFLVSRRGCEYEHVMVCEVLA